MIRRLLCAKTYKRLLIGLVHPFRNLRDICRCVHAVNRLTQVIFGVLHQVLQAMTVDTAPPVDQSRCRLKDFPLFVDQSQRSETGFGCLCLSGRF
jgi:hypothetical protein